MTLPTLEQRVAYLEAELARIHHLIQSNNSVQAVIPSTEGSSDPELPLGVFQDDPYFDEILKRMREERELDADNPAYT